MTKYTELTQDEFNANFPLLPNHLNPTASWTIGGGAGCLFETYGEELDFVRRQDSKTIWTLLARDNGDLLLVSGFQFFNRVGYLISTNPIKEGQIIQGRISRNSELDQRIASRFASRD